MNKKPNCLHCSKPLRPKYAMTCTKCNSPVWAHHMGSYQHLYPEVCDKVFPLASHYPELIKSGEVKRVLRGHGNYADDRFCGQLCGYRWAITRPGKGIGGDGNNLT